MGTPAATGSGEDMTPANIAPERLKQIQSLLSQTPYDGGTLAPLAGDASFRRYIRIHKNNNSAMLMDAPPAKEDVRPFVAAADYLYQKGYSAPGIIAQDVPAGLLLLEDMGDDSYTRILRQCDSNQQPQTEQELYGAAIDLLVEWHDHGTQFSNPEHLPLPRYDSTLLMREIGLFSDWFLPQVLGKEKAQALAPEYRALWERLIHTAPLAMDCWVHRDYHADNLMWLPERDGLKRVGLLDFQDGVYGDPAYDLVSLLEDARRDVSDELAQSMLDRYIKRSGVSPKSFYTAYAVLGAQRNSKIVGIFARLAARDGKRHYLDYLPRVWRHLERDLQHPVLLPLKHWLDRYVPASDRGVIDITHTAEDLVFTA
jgi:N-acetylmuramate 1-kinase